MASLTERKQKNLILCVEDELDLREILVEELRDADYEVEQASNGQEALLLLEHCRPDLILCDIAMPLMDGYELLRCIRENLPQLCDVPFVFLTAQDGSGQITQGKHAGADDYLVKPINFDLMLATIAARIRQMQRIQARFPAQDSPLRAVTGLHAQPKTHAFQSLSRMFNLISSGVVLLDRQGKVQFANIAAQRLASECISPMFLEILKANGQLAQTSSAVIRSAIKAALGGDEYTEFLSLPRRDGQRDLMVTVCALELADPDEGGPAAALFICSSNRDEPAPVKALEALFKLTPTEGKVAWAFAQGLRPDQVAAAFDISLTTVAFHKRNIFQKTHTNRQADLIALLLTLPASGEIL